MINPFTHRKILKRGKPGTARIVSMSTRDGGATSENVAMTLQVFVEGMTPYEVEDQWMVNHKVVLGFGLELPVKVDPGKPEKVAIDWDAVQAGHEAETAARRQALAAQGPVGAGGAVASGLGGVEGIQDPLAGGAVAASMGGLGAMLGGMMGQQAMSEPTIDIRNDPELRAKLEQVLGRDLTPGTTERIDTSSDPALAMQIMQVIQQHQLEKMGMGQPDAPPGAQTGGSDDALSRLERLAALRDSGALTDAEFEAEKKQLLGDL